MATANPDVTVRFISCGKAEVIKRYPLCTSVDEKLVARPGIKATDCATMG